MISAVVLTHNSTTTLERTLKSLTWCSELLIIDDDSKDATVEIARRWKAHVYRRSLNNDFAAQRNFGLEKAKGPWVLFVDSDEVVSEDLQKEILAAIAETGFDGYFLRRNDTVFGRRLEHGETSRVILLRLGKKKDGAWERTVHEVWNIKGRTRILINPLEHFPHPNVAQFLDDINTYSTINARYLFDKKVHTSWWHIPVYPAAKFLRNYFWLRGFADGTAGAVVALMMSFHSFLTRAKLWQLWDRHSPA